MLPLQRIWACKADGWWKDQQTNFAAKNEEKKRLLMACIDT